MSDYQVTNNGLCGECKWYKWTARTYTGYSREEWVCNNQLSGSYLECVDYIGTCDKWEQRGVE